MFLQHLPADVAAARLTEFKSNYPRAAAASNGRAERAARLSEIAHLVETTDAPGIFIVRSESNPLGTYTVNTLTKSCTCPDHGKFGPTGAICKHRLIVAYLTAFGRVQPTEAPAVPTLDQLIMTRYHLATQFCVLADQVVMCPEIYRTPETRARLVDLLRQCAAIQDQIDALEAAAAPKMQTVEPAPFNPYNDHARIK